MICASAYLKNSGSHANKAFPLPVTYEYVASFCAGNFNLRIQRPSREIKDIFSATMSRTWFNRSTLNGQACIKHKNFITMIFKGMCVYTRMNYVWIGKYQCISMRIFVYFLFYLFYLFTKCRSYRRSIWCGNKYEKLLTANKKLRSMRAAGVSRVFGRDQSKIVRILLHVSSQRW